MTDLQQGLRHGPVRPPEGSTARAPLGFDAVRLRPEGYWGAWQQRNHDVTLPHASAALERAGNLDNFRRLVGESTAPWRGYVFQDSDVYKHLEALAWEVGRTGDPRLDAEIAALTALVARAQQDDGYVNTCYQSRGLERYTNLANDHELYCAGHLFQAAVADHRATGSRRLLDVAVRFADHLLEVFGDDRRPDYDGHPEVETALVELGRETGRDDLVALGRQFVENRGRRVFTTGPHPTAGARGDSYFQDHLPVRVAPTIEGHSVRAMYLEAAVVDLAIQDGDAELLAASVRRWEDMRDRKSYLTGGTGSRHSSEAFGDPYELPPDRAYCETCAAIANVHWSWRLLLATGEARYADQVERLLFNAFAAGVGRDGATFFYSNPLQVRTEHAAESQVETPYRLSWYACACCPPNIARLVASLHHYAATTAGDVFTLQQFMDGDFRFSPNGSDSAAATVEVRTGYPWDGDVAVTVVASPVSSWGLALRVPAWCQEWAVELNGTPVDAGAERGYVALHREWAPGDTLRLRLAMPPRVTFPDPRIDAVRGCVALERGPVVYCLEAVDHPDVVLEDVTLDPSAGLEVVAVPDLDGVPGLRASGNAYAPPGGPLYGTSAAAGEATPVRLLAVPYQLWANRTSGAMRVFVPVTR